MKYFRSNPPSSVHRARADHQEAADDDINLAHRVAAPGADALGVEQLRALEHRGKPGGLTEGRPGGDLHPAGCDVERAVGKHRAPAGDPGLRMGLGKGQEPVDGAVMHLGIRVEQQKPLGARLGRDQVVGVGKAQIVGRGDQLHLGEGGGDGLGRAVGAGIVPDHGAEPHLAGLGVQRLQAFQRQVAGVVAYDDHRQFGIRGRTGGLGLLQGRGLGQLGLRLRRAWPCAGGRENPATFLTPSSTGSSQAGSVCRLNTLRPCCGRMAIR